MHYKYYLRICIAISIVFLITANIVDAEYNSIIGRDISNNYFNIKKNYESFLSRYKDKPGAKNKWMHRWLWNNRLDCNSNGEFKYLQQNNSDIIKQFEKEKDDKLLSQTAWVPVGPTNIPLSYDDRSCYSMGRVNCIAFHPAKANVLWIGTPGGGVWKTEDSGLTWFPLGDGLSTLAISDIAVDPNNPDIIYIATGDFDTGGLTSSNAQGVFKSSNGGETWSVTGLVLEPNFSYSLLRKIIINPNNSDQLIAAGRGGIWVSKDAGVKWEYVCNEIITDLEMGPTNPNILYAAKGQIWGLGSAGILKTTDFGKTWVELETGIPPKGEVSRVDIAISPVDNDYLYAIAVNGVTNGMHSFYRSTNGGEKWERMSIHGQNDNVLGAWEGDQDDDRGQGSYDLVLLPDRNDKNKVYTGGINIWMSENGGENWEIASFWIYCFGKSIHADHHYAAYNPLDKKYYWCNDGGVYRTGEILPGSKKWIDEWVDKYEENSKPNSPEFKFPTIWENLSDGLAITEFYRMSISKNNANVLAGGSQDNSCFFYNSGNWLNYIPNYDGMETMIDNDNPDIFYGVWQFGGLCKTTDGGKTLTYRLSDTISKQENGNWVTPTAMDPFNSERIYTGFRNLWRSENGGLLWEKVLDFDIIAENKYNRNSLSIIKVSPVDPACIAVYKESAWYLDTNNVWILVPGELWITKDACKTWERSTAGLPLDSINIISIDYDDKDSQKMWAAVYTNINTINTYITTDGGNIWTDISKPIASSVQVRTIIHQPDSPENTLYVGTNKGVYYTNDLLDKWVRFSDDLPKAIINELEIQPKTKELFAATYGRGIWKTNLIASSINEQKNSNTSISIYPNPSQGEFTIDIASFDTNEFNNAIVRIVDIRGRQVFQEELDKNSKRYSKIIKSKLKNGAYFVIVELDKATYSTKLIIKK